MIRGWFIDHTGAHWYCVQDESGTIRCDTQFYWTACDRRTFECWGWTPAPK